MKIVLLLCLLIAVIHADENLGSRRKHGKIAHKVHARSHHAQVHQQSTQNHEAAQHHLKTHQKATAKGDAYCRRYEESEDREKYPADEGNPSSGTGYRICQYVGGYELKICTEEKSWTASELQLDSDEPLKCTLGNTIFHVWPGIYKGIKIVGAREVQGPVIYSKVDWSWRVGVATDCVGFYLGILWKNREWTSVDDYTAYSTRISSCYITDTIESQASQAAISIFSSILGACGPVGDVLNIVLTMATQIPGVVDPKNNDIVHALAVCDIGTQLHERCFGHIPGYRYRSEQTARCRDATVQRRTSAGQYSFKGVGCSLTEGSEMDSDLYLKIYAGRCSEAGSSTLRLTTGKGILSRVCDGDDGFDYQLPDWSKGTTFDPSNGMCVKLYDADWGGDDYLGDVQVNTVLSEGSFSISCDWDGDPIDFTLTYNLVPR